MPPLLIPHVEESRLSALQLRLESLSCLSIDFLTLLACSTVIATFGLFQNSAAVIIGAMIIAPLMRPLVGLSLSTLTADTRLLTRALLTLFVGTIMGVGISALMAFCLRSLELTPEILGRTHPTLLDLGVAIFAGATGAYCQANEKLTDSLAGVAISVALVPPLSVVGIGFAFNSSPIWMGAALLYATNLVGITFAGAIVFLVMGFTPLTQARKGLAISALVATFLLVPLGFSMRELILENQISATIKTLLKEKTFTFRGVQLHDVQVKRFRTPMSVIATVLTSGETINGNQVRLVQDFLSREIGSPVEFRLRIIPSTELSANEVASESPAGSIITVPLSQKEEFIAPAQAKTTLPEEQPEETAPMKEPGKPGTEEAAPMNGPGKPGTEKTTPMKGPGKPGTEEAAHLNGPGKPGTEEAAHLNEPGKPGTEEAAHLNEPGKTGTVGTANMNDAGKPGTVGTANMTDAGKPGTVGTANMTDAGKPGAGDTVQTNKPDKPGTEGTANR